MRCVTNLKQTILTNWHSNNLKSLYYDIKKLSHLQSNSPFAEYALKDGKILNKEESINEFVAFYKALYNQINYSAICDERHMPRVLYSKKEIMNSIEFISINKAMSTDLFPDELLKCDSWKEQLSKYIEKILNGERWPSDYLAIRRYMLQSKKGIKHRES